VKVDLSGRGSSIANCCSCNDAGAGGLGRERDWGFCAVASGSDADAKMMYLSIETHSARETSSVEHMQAGRTQHMTCRDERHV
jgi:hypothetical protein